MEYLYSTSSAAPFAHVNDSPEEMPISEFDLVEKAPKDIYEPAAQNMFTLASSASDSAVAQGPRKKTRTKNKPTLRRPEFGLHQLVVTVEELVAIRPSFNPDSAESSFKLPPERRVSAHKRRLRLTDTERTLLSSYRISKGGKAPRKRKAKYSKEFEERKAAAEQHFLATSHKAHHP